jgi:WD40 repeat protein
LIVHDVGTGDIVHRLRGHQNAINDVALEPDGKFAVTVARDGEIRFWDIQGNAGELRGMTVGGDAYALALNPDGTRIAVSVGDPFTAPEEAAAARISILNAATGQELGRISAHRAPVNSLAFSPDGRRLLSTSADGSATLWQITRSEGELSTAEIFSLDDQDAPFFRASFGPDGERALVGGYQNEMRLWNLTTGDAERHFVDDQGHSAAVVAVAFSPDGSQALSGGADGRVILWDVESGRVLHRLGEHEDTVMSVAFSPDGRSAVSGSLDQKIVRWNLETGEEIRAYEAHEGGVMRVAFSPDGMLILSAARDGTVQMWDLMHDMPARRFSVGNVQMDDLVFSADGRRVYSTSNRVHEWLLPRLMPIDELMTQVNQNRYVPVLDCEQQEQFLFMGDCEGEANGS